jgi:8-oxo-dGTP diphosphatase
MTKIGLAVERRKKLVVAALVRDENGRILLSKRRADQPMGLLWELPGGKVEAGEAPVDALEREIKEELGARVEVGRIDDVVFHRYAEFDLLMLVYACHLLDTPRAVQVEAIAWVSPRDLDGYELLPADRPLAERYRKESK